MKTWGLFAALLWVLSGAAAPAYADAAKEEDEEGELLETLEAEEPTVDAHVPEVLDFFERNAELYRFEVTPFVGAYLGDTLQNSFLVGGLWETRLSPDISLGAEFGWSRISFDPTGSFGRTVTDKNLYLPQGFFSYHMPAAYFSQDKVVETDFFTTLGGGLLRINGSNRWDGFVGGGMKIYYQKLQWMALRVEVRNYFSTLHTPTGRDFTSDMVFTVGPLFRIPPRLF